MPASSTTFIKFFKESCRSATMIFRYTVGKVGGQSKCLRFVDLRVSTKEWNNTKMFLTELNSNSMGEFKDPCSGDSGGPLMYQEPSSGRWIIIGQLNYLKLVTRNVL